MSREQALEVVTLGQLRGLREGGLLVVVQRGVFRLAGAAPSWRQRAMAAHLAYGSPSAISHRAAARLWSLEGIQAKDPEITVPKFRHGGRAGILTHRARLPESDVTARYGIPVTTPCRTLADLAGITSAYLLERVVDQALRARLLGARELDAYVRIERGGGHRGVTALRELLALRVEHPGAGDSELEDRIYAWIVESGLEVPQRQVPVTIGGTVWILDIAYPDRRLALEPEGFDFHGRRHRFDADAARYDELVLAGWKVLRVTSKHSRQRVVAGWRGPWPPTPSRADAIPT